MATVTGKRPRESERDAGVLYVVATPIGNLEDLGARARRILAEVDVVAAEDTRMTTRLLSHYAISTPMLSLHEHNERQRSPALIARLQQGESVALVSDAGTPLVSDPGHLLVSSAVGEGIRVVPIAGPSAVITALSASGLAVHRFAFDGFLPPKQGARRGYLESLINETRTVAVFESPRRIQGALADMQHVLGNDRRVVVARELTKTFEQFYRGTLGELMNRGGLPESERRGEIVILIEGGESDSVTHVDDDILAELVASLPVKQAADIVARITGERRNAVYERALSLRQGTRDS